MTVGAFELGGSHVAAAAVDLETGAVDERARTGLDGGADRAVLVAALRAAVRPLAGVERLGAAVPGPFDYERGICTIHGVGKLDALRGVDVRAELASELALGPEAVVFLNDAEAFLLGEVAAGAARGHDRVVGLTLGTGLGSAFLAAGRLVRDGDGVPPDGEIHVAPFRGGNVEDVISGRGISARVEGSPTAAEIAARADGGDAEALAAYAAFGAGLAELVDGILDAFAPTRVVIGGSIARAWRHFAAPLPAIAVRAARIDDAALIGAARWAASSDAHSC